MDTLPKLTNRFVESFSPNPGKRGFSIMPNLKPIVCKRLMYNKPWNYVMIKWDFKFVSVFKGDPKLSNVALTQGHCVFNAAVGL